MGHDEAVLRAARSWLIAISRSILPALFLARSVSRFSPSPSDGKSTRSPIVRWRSATPALPNSSRWSYACCRPAMSLTATTGGCLSPPAISSRRLPPRCFLPSPLSIRRAMALVRGPCLVRCRAQLCQPGGAAFVPQLVPRDQFPEAVAWNSSIFQIAVIAGPALGGAIYILGPAIAYAICL